MNDYDEYEFRFDAYTPDTIPMERLAKYLAALSKLLGYESSVHFERVDSGSTRPMMRVEREATPKVAQRLSEVGRGVAANDAMAGFDELNHLLRDDSASGWLKRLPAGEVESALILSFAGKNLPRPVTFGPFNEPATIDGELVKIGGRDKSAHATITDLEGKNWSGELSRELAQKIAPYLYLGPILRVSGDARWSRLEDGSWNLILLKISNFEVLKEDTLSDATARMRQLRGTDWAGIDDLDAFINAERGENDGLH